MPLSSNGRRTLVRSHLHPAANPSPSDQQQQEQHQPLRQQQQKSEIPANLRRKLKVRRPFLGHVVPKSRRQHMQSAQRQSGGSSAPHLRRQGQEPSRSSSSQLRISAGVARGRKLESPNVFLRPMMGKVKEAVFSTLTSFGVYDTTCRHLDVFAGSGNVGLESLSRGASECVFVDLSRDCCACIERNIESTGLTTHSPSSSSVVVGDALTILQNGLEDKTFHVITICPPYEEVVYADLLDAVVGSSLVMEDTVVVVEYPVELFGDVPHVISSGEHTAVGVRNRRYGRTVIAMYVIDPTGKLDAESRPEEFVLQ